MRILLLSIIALALLSSVELASASIGTYPYTTGTFNGASSPDNICTASSQVTDGTVFDSDNSPTNEPVCKRTTVEFDVSSISSSIAVIMNATLRYDIASYSGTQGCSFWSLENDPSVSFSAAFDDAKDGTKFIDDDSGCTTASLDKTISFTTAMKDDLLTKIQSGNGWYGLGISLNTENDGGTETAVDFDDVELEIFWNTTEDNDPITDLVGEFIISGAPLYSLNYTWTEPVAENIIGYNIQIHNSTGWFTVINNTGNTDTYYEFTDLGQSVWHAANVTYWSTPNGQGPGSNISNITTIDPVFGNLTTYATVVGDILGIGAELTEAVGFPYATITTIKSMVNGTVDDTLTVNDTFMDTSYPTYYIPIEDETTVEHQATVMNFTGDTLLFNSTLANVDKLYEPDYFTSVEGSYNVNYTHSRSGDGETLNLNVNRDPITFQIECHYQNGTEALKRLTGDWSNHTGVGFLNDAQPVPASSNIYVTCYNDEKLFQFTSYSPANATLASIGALEDSLGDFFGVPLGLFFVLLVAGLATGRSAPTFIVVVLGTVGIMAALGFFVVDSSIWALIIIGGAIGLIAGKKFL